MTDISRATRLLFLGATTLAALSSAACSSDDTGDNTGSGGSANSGGTTSTGGTEGDPWCAQADPASTCPPTIDEASLPANVSFSTQIYPIFMEACTGAGCHTNATAWSSMAVGSPTMPLDAAGISALIATLKTDPSKVGGTGVMNVVPNAWDQSFLMHVLDGCQNKVGLTTCTDSIYAVCGEPCGDGMPQSNGSTTPGFPLPAEQRNLVRAWIQQGALDN